MKRFSQLCACILACTCFVFPQVISTKVTIQKESHPVTSEVHQRTPQPIPDDVTVRLVPAGSEPIDDERKVYQFLNNDMWATIYIENRSKQRLKSNVIDPHYGNRLQLFKDDVQIPYREEIANIIRGQEENLKQVHTWRDIVIEPQTTHALQNITLYDWFGPLAPGIYRVIIRHRFEIGGSWTRDSVPMFFEVPGLKLPDTQSNDPFRPKLTKKPAKPN